MDPILLIDFSPHALWVQACIEFLCPSKYGIDVYLTWKSVLICWFLDILLHLLMLKLAFYLIADPFKTILLEICLHILYFLLQLFILWLHLFHFLVLLSGIVSVILEKSVLCLDFFQGFCFLLCKIEFTLIYSRWFLHVISTVFSLAAIVVSRSPSVWDDGGFNGFCLGGSLGAYSLLNFLSGLPDENGVISAAKSFRIRLEISSSSISGVG